MALCAIFLCVAGFSSLALPSPNVSRASAAPPTTTTPTPTATSTPSETPSITATDTATPTNTATATVDPCSLRPTASLLKKPKKGAQYSSAVATLRIKWSASECATYYQLKIIPDGKKGKPQVKKLGLKKEAFTFRNIPSGHTYYWYVNSCNAAGCAKSRWGRFTIASGAPKVTPTPLAVSTPAADLPTRFGNYQGPGVYVNAEDPVYYFPCEINKYVHLRDLVLVIVDGLKPGEAVNAYGYEISAVPQYNWYNGYYIADSNGQVRTAINTSAWTDGHFHIYYTGKSSKIQWCGHFDLYRGP